MEQNYQEGGDNGVGVFYLVAGLAVLVAAGVAVWYVKSNNAAKSASDDDVDEYSGIDVDIQQPDAQTDNTITTSAYTRPKVEAITMDSVAPTSITSISSGSSNTISTSPSGSKFAKGQTVFANGSQSVQRMAKATNGGFTDKNKNGKLLGYSKVKNNLKLGTIEELRAGGAIIKAPPAYIYSYYYVTNDQIKTSK